MTDHSAAAVANSLDKIITMHTNGAKGCQCLFMVINKNNNDIVVEW